MNSTLVVCTRNRSIEVKGLLEHLTHQTTLPQSIVIVDSSEDGLTQVVAENLAPALHIQFFYVRAMPAAPHQKNVGLRFARDMLKSEIVFFLDDDVRPNRDYFLSSLELFKANPKISCLGGFDENVALRSGFIARSGLKKRFRVHRGGYFSYAKNPGELDVADWVPGGMQSMRLARIGMHEFIDNWRIYGDEVEFQTRVFTRGEIATSRALGCSHLASSGAKESRSAESENYIHFRWWFVHNARFGASKPHFFVTTLAILLAKFPLAIVRSETASSLRGEVSALLKIMTGKSDVAKVEISAEDLYFRNFSKS